MPRVSAATGGLTPGIDLTDSAALQDAEDVDYLRRMDHAASGHWLARVIEGDA